MANTMHFIMPTIRNGQRYFRALGRKSKGMPTLMVVVQNERINYSWCNVLQWHKKTRHMRQTAMPCWRVRLALPLHTFRKPFKVSQSGAKKLGQSPTYMESGAHPRTPLTQAELSLAMNCCNGFPGNRKFEFYWPEQTVSVRTAGAKSFVLFKKKRVGVKPFGLCIFGSLLLMQRILNCPPRGGFCLHWDSCVQPWPSLLAEKHMAATQCLCHDGLEQSLARGTTRREPWLLNKLKESSGWVENCIRGKPICFFHPSPLGN